MLKNLLKRFYAPLNDSLVIKFKKLRDGAKLPSKSYKGDLGYDLTLLCDSHFMLDNKDTQKWCIDLEPLTPRLFEVGFSTEIPQGYGILLRDRSGLSSKGIHVLGGVIDAQYRGPWKVCLVNLSSKSYRLYEGDRICQAIIVPQIDVSWTEVTNLSETKRGSGGHGSSGR